MSVKQERSGWRDENLSRRHRDWGFDCPAVDIDFIMLEYNKAKAVAVIEYKNEHAPLQFAKQANYQALIDMCNRAGLPFFAVRYSDTFVWFRVAALNAAAKKHFNRKEMTEIEYVAFLYNLRELSLPAHLKNQLQRKSGT